MASIQVDVSEKALLELADSILSTLQDMNRFNNDLSSDLKSLGSTFKDEGYKTVVKYVDKAESIIADNAPHAADLANRLIAYAKLVHQSRESI